MNMQYRCLHEHSQCFCLLHFKMSFTIEEKAHCVVWYAAVKSQKVTQRKFRAHFFQHGNGKKIFPNKVSIKLWYSKFMNFGDINRKKERTPGLLNCFFHWFVLLSLALPSFMFFLGGSEQSWPCRKWLRSLRMEVSEVPAMSPGKRGCLRLALSTGFSRRRHFILTKCRLTKNWHLTIMPGEWITRTPIESYCPWPKFS